jgi:hypothetical protein
MSDPTTQTPMQPNEPVVCDCCELETPRDLAYRSTTLTESTVAVSTMEQFKMTQEHEDEVRKRWDETVDLWHAAEDRADPRLGTCSWVRPGSSLSLTVLLELLDNAVRVNVPQPEVLAGLTDLGLGEYGHRLLGPPAPVRAGFSDLHLDRRILGKR